jgi:spore maturation protein CgeB
MYELFGSAKIVLNCAVDAAGNDRGNMRCFEAMGCGALLVTDPGQYPKGMGDAYSMRVYQDSNDLVGLLGTLLSDDDLRTTLAERGLRTMREQYSKRDQWRHFVKLVSAL